jgi:hypothetical protein
MNTSALVLLGAFDALIAIIQSERSAFCKSFDPDAAIQTLRKIKTELAQHLLAYTRAQGHASDTFRTTIAQLLADLPQGSDIEPLVQALQLTVVNYLPQGPTPPWPSMSSSRSPLGFSLPGDLPQLIASLQRMAESKPKA